MILDCLLFPAYFLLLHVLGIGLLRVRPAAQYHIPDYGYCLAALFAIGVWAVCVNFFSGVYSPVFYIPLLALFVLGLLRWQRSDCKALWYILPITLLLVPLAAQMQPGYDAGLYHLPHQLLIRDEKVIFGMANLHSRYGGSSLIEYILAPLWAGENFKLLAYTQAAFVVLLLLYLRHLARLPQAFGAALSLLTVAGMLVYSVYFSFLYVSTDTPAGILFAIAFLQGMVLLLDDRPVRRDQVNMLLLSALFAWMCKTSAMLIGLWALFILFRLLQTRRLAWADARGCVLWPAIITTVWSVKNLIVSGCLVFPLAASCPDLAWSAEAMAVENANGVTAWARQPGADLRPLQSWDWFSAWWWPTYARFCINMLSVTACLAAAYVIVLRRREPYRWDSLIPALVFILANLAVWFLKAPTPRFGIGVFILLSPVLALALSGLRRFSMDGVLVKACCLLILVLACKLGGFPREFSLRSAFNPLRVPTVVAVADANFGYRPALIKGQADDQCWLVKYCAPDNRPVLKEAYGYKIFISDRRD